MRDGIEDWEVFNIVPAAPRRGGGTAHPRRQRALLGHERGVVLGRTVGCQLKTSTPFAWPEYSHNATTPSRIERANLQALPAASN